MKAASATMPARPVARTSGDVQPDVAPVVSAYMNSGNPAAASRKPGRSKRPAGCSEPPGRNSRPNVSAATPIGRLM
jgi:hypothetical protein